MYIKMRNELEKYNNLDFLKEKIDKEVLIYEA